VTASERGQEVERGRILRFRPRTLRGPSRPPAPVEGLQKYENAGEPDDYAHRMKVNVVAFAFIVLLTVIGVWLAQEMALLRVKQDCALAGRKTCPELDLMTRDRRSGFGADHRQGDRSQAPVNTDLPRGGG
jgi:hypothetical protein